MLILWRHDHARPIGVVEPVGDKLCFRFNDDVVVHEDALFEIFGGAGIRVTESEWRSAARIVKAGEILEFSYLGS